MSDTIEDNGERRVRFEYGRTRIDLRISRAGERWDLRGTVDPPQLRIELELEGAPVVVADGTTGGTFGFEAVPSAILRLRVVQHEAVGALPTDWFHV